MGEACGQATEPLPSIFPGSWINSDFYIWIGHQDDHRAWSQLADARRALELGTAGLSDDSLARAREEMFIAEGSDWFWWYGDDHSSDHDLEFDDLFRRHVRNIYRALEKPIPEELFVTNITTLPPDVEIHRPTGFIEPIIDGRVTNYFEWIGAGCVDVAPTAGAMHRVSDRHAGLALIEFGFDLDHLFLRVDGMRPMSEILDADTDLSINFFQPVGVRVELRANEGVAEVTLLTRDSQGAFDEVAESGIIAAVGPVAELQIPFSRLGVIAQEAVAFMVGLNRGTTELEHHPRHRPIEFEVPDSRFAAVNWTA
jgi:hypothetical protein